MLQKDIDYENEVAAFKSDTGMAIVTPRPDYMDYHAIYLIRGCKSAIAVRFDCFEEAINYIAARLS